MSESHLPALGREATKPEAIEREGVDLEDLSEVATTPKARSHVGRWLGIVAVALVMGLIWMALGQTEDAETTATAMNGGTIAAEVGALAPDFSLTSLSGETVHLSQFHGKPVILNFWATWCGPCLSEMPALEQIWQEGGGDVVVLGVDQGESLQRVQGFIGETVDVSFPILLDTQHEVGDAYFVRALPTTLFIDPNGFIHEIRVGGPLSHSFLQERVAQLQAQ